MLSGDGKLRSRKMLLNGNVLELGANDELPALTPVAQPAGTMKIASGSCVFLVM